MPSRILFYSLLITSLIAAETLPADQAARQIQSGDFAGAAAVLTRALKGNPADPALWNLLGISETELQQPRAAREAFEHGIQLAPASPDLHENLGLLYYRQGDFASAKATLAKAVALGSNKPGVVFSLAAARIRTGEREQGLAALRALESALARVPDYWDERGWAELPVDPAAAEISFQRALLLAPDDLRAINGSASALEAQGQDEKALSVLLQAKQQHPHDVETLIHFGKVCLRRDLIADALKSFEQARALDPGNDTALYLYARAQVGMRQWGKAYDLFSAYARRHPRFAPVYYALGWLNLQMGKPAEARRHLEQCLALAPHYPDPEYELAQLDLDDGRLDAAGARLRSVLAEDPRHVRANIALGDLMLRRGDAAEAEKHYRIAVEQAPGSGAAHYKLSTALMRLHRPADAESERALGVKLSAQEQQASRIVLHLAAPDGTLLTSNN